MSVEQREVNGEVLVAVLLGIRASAAALQQQTEAALCFWASRRASRPRSAPKMYSRKGPRAPCSGKRRSGG